MLKFLKFLKKNKEENPAEKEAIKEEEKKITDEELDKEIIIHVMPERFHLLRASSHKAKKTGLVILAGGFLFFIVLAGFLYFYLFGPGSKKESPKVSVPAVKKEEKAKVEERATSSPKENIATSTVLSAETDLGQATTTEEGATTTPESEPLFLSGLDSDSDGLTDKEEELLGTDKNNPDSDGDNYSDFIEISNFYDPSIYASGRLADNKHVKKYENNAFSYSIFYPAAWEVSAVGGNDSIVFKSPDNQFMQVIGQPNVEREAIDDWYKKQFNAAHVDEAKRISGKGWVGVKNDSGLIVYLSDSRGNYILTVSYSPAVSSSLDYLGILGMMLKSLEIRG